MKAAPKISVVINADTRPQNDSEGEMGKGVVNLDFLVHGVVNKINFFVGFDIEVILFVDVHEPLHPMTIAELHRICDTVVLRKHRPWGSENCAEKHNDYNYLHALSLARGEYVAHFDMDMAAFTRDEQPILQMLEWLEKYAFVCYPSEHSPAPCHDDSFDYWWASTRFFICKREQLNIGGIAHCLHNKMYFDNWYKSKKDLHWMEHIIGRMVKFHNMYPVFYPPFDLTNYAIWSWKSYINGTLPKLNRMQYDKVGEYINECNGIFYPCDLSAKEIK